MYTKLLFTFLFFSGFAFADNFSDNLKQAFGSPPDAVRDSQIPGVKAVSYGMDILYVTTDGKYFFSGDLFDLSTRKNLSEQQKGGARKALMDSFAGKDKVISFKAKNEKYALAVFTDIDCPFCAKLHREVPALNKKGVTINYYLFPRSGEGTASYKKAESVWCNENQQEAMTKAKERSPVPSKICDNPVKAQYEFGQKVGVTGTPALVTASGKLIPGYMPADRLVKLLEKDAR